jgi:prephenate dehydrogenase
MDHVCFSEVGKLMIATKVGTIVAGQTSCKAPEIAAFEKYLPDDVEILTCHSLHGPNVDPQGQPLVKGLKYFVLIQGANSTSCLGQEFTAYGIYSLFVRLNLCLPHSC